MREEVDNYVGAHEWHAVYTITLGQLIDSGVFDWEREQLSWRVAAYDEEQYERVCAYFIKRFYYREISIEPFGEWANFLQRKLIYELSPKYNPLYARIADGINPLAESDEFYKNRTIQSAYPETLLSDNADYITDGRDEEYERVKEKAPSDAIIDYAQSFKNVDELLLDELESLFVCMYSANLDASW